MVAQEFHDLGHDGLLLDQVVDVVALAPESANRERRTVQRQRRNDRVDTRTVGQARVNHRRRFIDPASDLGHDAIDDQHQVLIVLELDLGGVELAALLDVNLVMPVDQDVGDFIVPQQRLERPQSQQLVFDLFYKMILVGVGEQPALVVKNRRDSLGHFLRGQHRLEAFEPGHVQRLEQPVVNRQFELLKALGLRVLNSSLGGPIAHQRTLEGRRRGRVLLRNSFNQLHGRTSTTRADNVQQA